MKKILFIQLPLLDHAQGYLTGNIEYAPASMAAYINRRCSSRIETHILPRNLSLFGSDEIILRYFRNLSPDAVAFTCYLWNIERSLSIAVRMKEQLESCEIFFGGPEIAQGSVAMNSAHPYIDRFVTGEGEWFFDRLLNTGGKGVYEAGNNGNRVLCQTAGELIDAQTIVEPFTANYLNPMPDGSIFLEMTRGCPYRCSYCYYSKNCLRVRELPFDILERCLTGRSGITEAYLLSPTFDRTSDFHEKLRRLAVINRGVLLHTEMRTDRMTPETAELIYRAGFHSLEVGLQTLNRGALEKVRRGGDPDRELEGMIMLQKAGVDLKIGVIPGLPGDTPESFAATIDRLVDAGLAGSIELYPLMVLPGAAIRDAAISDGADFMNEPPYYYLKGWGFDTAALKEIIWYSESRTGFSHVQRRLPDFIRSGEGGLIAGVSFNGDALQNWKFSRWGHLVDTNVFSVFITLSRPDRVLEGMRYLGDLFGRSELFNLVFFHDGLLHEAVIERAIADFDSDSLYRRLHRFDPWRDGLPVRFYQVMDEFRVFRKALDGYSLIEPIIRLTGRNLELLARSKLEECNVLVPGGGYGPARDYLVGHYADAVEHVAFESESEQQFFYNDIGFEHLAFPYSFRVIDLM